MVLQENSISKSFVDFLNDFTSIFCFEIGPILEKLTTQILEQIWGFSRESHKLQKVEKNVQIQFCSFESHPKP